MTLLMNEFELEIQTQPDHAYIYSSEVVTFSRHQFAAEPNNLIIKFLQIPIVSVIFFGWQSSIVPVR